jgi:acetyl esterase/lipase
MPAHRRTRDVIYGRKHGLALTLDVLTPEKANGAAVIWVMSGGWISTPEWIDLFPAQELLRRGYTVFTVVHGSIPKFTIPEIVPDIHRAVRFVRHHATDFGIDPDRIGIAGGSAGGHLSLMQGTAGAAGDPSDSDPVERESSRVQAVACVSPPTDFLNYGREGKVELGRGVLFEFRSAFDFHAFDSSTRAFVPVRRAAKVKEIGRRISPISHVSAGAAPTLILHGDADTVVPIQQAESFVARLKQAGVPAELVVKPGAGHSWRSILADMKPIADWFDVYLRKPASVHEGAWRPGAAPLARRASEGPSLARRANGTSFPWPPWLSSLQTP